jgi:hypothetical protein
MKKFKIILSLSIFYIVLANNCQAQIININDKSKEIESLKLKTGQLISHDEFSATKFVKGKITTSEKEVIYTYIGDEVENATNILFNKDENYSNTEKLDNTHFRVYSAPEYFRDDDNIIHKIEIGTTTPEIWNKASVPTLIDKITSILKTPYALAGTSYGTNDEYLAAYNNTNWYDVRTTAIANDKSSEIVAYNWHQPYDFGGEIYYNYRTPINFDLSLINPANILSGSINMYSEDPAETVEHSYAFYKGTQAIPATLNDYSSFENNLYTNVILNSNVLSDAFTNWNFNNDGLNYLKAGNSSFMFMETMFDVGSTTPPNYTDITEGRSFKSSLDWDFNKHPYIELTVSSGGGSTTTPAVAGGSDIGVIYYNATTTKIDDNTTITSATYKIPFLLFKFVSIIIAFCFAVLITFFLSFINKKKKL